MKRADVGIATRGAYWLAFAEESTNTSTVCVEKSLKCVDVISRHSLGQAIIDLLNGNYGHCGVTTT